MILLYKDRSPHLTSCKIIKKNFFSLYQSLSFHPFTYVYFDFGTPPTEMIDDLLTKKPAHEARFIFHLYGDFIYCIDEWLRIFRRLKEYPIKIICLSHAQKSLVASFVSNENIFILFPSLELSRERVSRKEMRENLKISQEERVFFYAGRLTKEKGVLNLMRAFLQLNLGDATLLIAGEVDHAGSLLEENDDFVTELAGLEKINLLFKNKIVFLNKLDLAEMGAMYEASDYYINLTSSHSEDFSLGLREALIRGLPCIVTDWGGLKNYNTESLPAITYISLEKTPLGPKLHEESVVKAMKENLNKKFQKSEISKIYHEKQSLEVQIKTINDILNAPWKTLDVSNVEVGHAGNSVREWLFDSRINAVTPNYDLLFKGFY